MRSTHKHPYYFTITGKLCYFTTIISNSNFPEDGTIQCEVSPSIIPDKVSRLQRSVNSNENTLTSFWREARKMEGFQRSDNIPVHSTNDVKIVLKM